MAPTAAGLRSRAAGRPDVDLLDPEFHVGDPHPAYRWMRAHEPVYRDRNGIWCVTRMDHLRHVERHAASFVSSRGYRSRWFPEETSMISQDDPGHGHQRKLVADLFTPRSVGRLADDIGGLVDDALAPLAATERFEVVDTLAARIPALVTCRLLGWPDSHWRDVRSWSERLMRVDTMASNLLHRSDGVRAVTEMAALVDETVPARRGCPADDMLSRWANAELDGCPMSPDQIVSELGLVVPGGAETTRTTLARSLILFAERNDLWEALAADPASIPTAVEELLRWITPINNMFRVVAEDTDIDGVPVRAGGQVALVYPSANRDERVFADPETIDLGRDPNPHISFGLGTHFCLGAHVARLVLRVVLERLTARITDLTAAAPPRYEPNVFVKAVEHFELGFTLR